MSKVTYITLNGERLEIDVQNGYTVMEGAVDNGIEGIEAECGGACACTTCHSYIDEEWISKMPPIDEFEGELLDELANRKPNSRLTCQLEMRDEWDGLVVHVCDNRGER